jgi:hypothetical protein
MPSLAPEYHRPQASDAADEVVLRVQPQTAHLTFPPFKSNPTHDKQDDDDD